MFKRSTFITAGLGLLLAIGCSKGGTGTTPPGDGPPDAPAERASLTSAECEAKGGTIVGDIGDGAIHRPDYKCEGGQPPLGSIKAEGDAPVAVEGSVCCPAAAPADAPPADAPPADAAAAPAPAP